MRSHAHVGGRAGGGACARASGQRASWLPPVAGRSTASACSPPSQAPLSSRRGAPCDASSNSTLSGSAQERAESGSGASSSGCSRRGVLRGAAALLAAASPVPAATAAAAAPASFLQPLQPLLPGAAPNLAAWLSGSAPVAFPGVAWALRNRDRQLYYPHWLQGEWEVTATFAGASFPQGQRLVGRTVPGVLKGSMVVALPDVGAAMEGPVRYTARFVPAEQQQRGGGGAGAEGSGASEASALDTVADRVHNARQLMDAFYGLPVTRRVDYEPADNPTRMTVVYATPRRETSVISEDLRKAEIIINNRYAEQPAPGEFLCAEVFRQVSQASAQGFVGDYMTISRFKRVARAELLPPAVAREVGAGAGGGAAGAPPAAAQGGTALGGAEGSGAGAVSGAGGGGGASPEVVLVEQRVAAFLQPQDAAYFDAGGKAVALYDYSYVYRRVG